MKNAIYKHGNQPCQVMDENENQFCITINDAMNHPNTIWVDKEDVELVDESAGADTEPAAIAALKKTAPKKAAKKK
ncbi:MAG: hypothetical protein K2X48_07585 [Chitinophagaceae bacterium]|nr:hypothetical protein [Chitinophagaceae bacterium]